VGFYNFTETPSKSSSNYSEHALLVRFLSSPLNSPATHNVVDAYYHAITSAFPRKRYAVGWDAQLIYVPLSLVPATIQDAFLRGMYKLMGAPKAAVLKGKPCGGTGDGV